MRKSQIRVASAVLIIVGLAIIFHASMVILEVSGYNSVSINRAIRMQAYLEYTVAIIFMGIGSLTTFMTTRMTKI